MVADCRAHGEQVDMGWGGVVTVDDDVDRTAGESAAVVLFDDGEVARSVNFVRQIGDGYGHGIHGIGRGWFQFWVSCWSECREKLRASCEP